MNNSNSNTENADDLATGLNSFFNQLHLLVDDISEIVQSVLDVSIEEVVNSDSGKADEDMLDWREFLNGLNLGDNIGEDDAEWIEGYNAGYSDAQNEFDAVEAEHNQPGELEDDEAAECYDRGYSDAKEEIFGMYIDELFSVFFGENNNRVKSEDTTKFDQETESELKELIENFLFEKFGTDELND